jgi:hypothetical protein
MAVTRTRQEFPLSKRGFEWVKRDVFHRMFKDLSSDSDFEYTMIDGTICKTQMQLGAKGTQARLLANLGPGMTTKILALTDALGNLIDFRLMPGTGP